MNKFSSSEAEKEITDGPWFWVYLPMENDVQTLSRKLGVTVERHTVDDVTVLFRIARATETTQAELRAWVSEHMSLAIAERCAKRKELEQPIAPAPFPQDDPPATLPMRKQHLKKFA